MKRCLFGCLLLFAFTTGAFAAAPATNAPAPAIAAPAAATAPATATGGSKLDDYIKELTTALKLTDKERQRIEGYYVADGAHMQDILNNDAFSSLEKARQVSDLRDTRNVKIESLLDDLDREQEFFKIEARYRVALTELAANGGLVAAQPPAPSTPPAPNKP